MCISTTYAVLPFSPFHKQTPRLLDWYTQEKQRTLACKHMKNLIVGVALNGTHEVQNLPDAPSISLGRTLGLYKKKNLVCVFELRECSLKKKMMNKLPIIAPYLLCNTR